MNLYFPPSSIPYCALVPRTPLSQPPHVPKSAYELLCGAIFYLLFSLSSQTTLCLFRLRRYLNLPARAKEQTPVNHHQFCHYHLTNWAGPQYILEGMRRKREREREPERRMRWSGKERIMDCGVDIELDPHFTMMDFIAGQTKLFSKFPKFSMKIQMCAIGCVCI